MYVSTYLRFKETYIANIYSGDWTKLWLNLVKAVWRYEDLPKGARFPVVQTKSKHESAEADTHTYLTIKET